MLYDLLITHHICTDHIVLTDTKSEFRYSEIHSSTMALVEELTKRNVKAGQRILLINHNSIYTVCAILACIYLRVCFVIVPADSSPEQLDYIKNDAETCIIIDSSAKFGEGITNTGLYCDAKREDLVYLIYTSGSTGKPKGVMAAESQVAFCIKAINERLGNSSSDRILCCLPLSFDYGLYQLFFALTFESVLVLPRKFLIQEIPRLLKHERITGFPTIPSILSMLLHTRLLSKAYFPDLRYITSTGDLLPVPIIRQLMILLPNTEILPMYGQTECKRVSILPFGCKQKALDGSCGLPLDGSVVWLDEMDEKGIGELVVSGPNVMEGYLHSDEMAGHYYFTHPEHGRCLRTGDLFKIDRDGYLYFVSRKRRILKSNGYRIGSLELETLFLERMTLPYECIRITSFPDRFVGERILLCVCSSIAPDVIAAEVRDIIVTLPGYQRPSRLYVTTSAFPQNNNGKIDDVMLIQEALKHDIITL